MQPPPKPPTKKDPLSVAEIVDRLATHKVLVGLPGAELEWLAAHGELRRLKVGDVAQRKGDPVDAMFILFSGLVSMYLERGTGRRHLLDTGGDDISGLLPFSRLSSPPVSKR